MSPLQTSILLKKFGPNLAYLKVRIAQLNPEQVRTDYVNTPEDIMYLSKNVKLGPDVMLINRIYFMVRVERKI